MLVTCSRCGRTVHRMRHLTNGKVLMIDGKPNIQQGYISINEAMGTYVGLARPSDADKRQGLYLPHYLSCNGSYNNG